MSEKSRKRNFATIVYPESAPDHWQDILAQELVPAFISPLHDADINPTGEPKKAHYHVLIMFEGLKTDDQAKVIFDKIGGVGLDHINSMRGYARYLCHLDNPEKAQYKIDDVRCICGADYVSTIGLPTDKYKAIREMMEYICDNDIIAFCDLLDYASVERMDWFRVLCDSSSYVIKEYIKSKLWKHKIMQ